jgi:hypothetical protein
MFLEKYMFQDEEEPCYGTVEPWAAKRTYQGK